MSAFHGLWLKLETGGYKTLQIGDDFFELQAIVKASAAGEVLALAYQDTSDYFACAVCFRGECRRHLEYEGGSGWAKVEGRPQDWEPDVFFSEELRSSNLNVFEPEPDGRARVEKAFAERTLAAGNAIPLLNVEGAVYGVIKRLGLPR